MSADSCETVKEEACGDICNYNVEMKNVNGKAFVLVVL